MSDQPNRAVGAVISFRTLQEDDPDWPFARIVGEIKDDLDGRLYKYSHLTFKAWYEARPLVGKRVRFLKFWGSQGNVAEEVELV